MSAGNSLINLICPNTATQNYESIFLYICMYVHIFQYTKYVPSNKMNINMRMLLTTLSVHISNMFVYCFYCLLRGFFCVTSFCVFIIFFRF